MFQNGLESCCSTKRKPQERSAQVVEKSTSVSQRGVKPPVARKAKVLCRGAPRMCLGSTRRLVTQAEQLPVVMDSKFTSAGDIASLAAAVAVVVAVAQP